LIVDIHTHIFPDALAHRAVNGKTEQYTLTHYSDGTEAGLRRSMREAGVTHSVLCSITVKPGQSKKTNEFAAKFLDRKAENGTQILPFASVHPLEDDWRTTLRAVKEMGFRGIKLHPDYQNFYVDDVFMEPIYRELARLGLVVLFHAGRDIGLPGPTHATPRRFANIIDLLEPLKAVIAHMGSHEYEQDALKYLCGRDVYFDTSYSLDRMDAGMAREIIRRHSPERMLFGSDSPWTGQKEAVGYFTKQFAPGFLSSGDMDKVLWANAADLLGLHVGIATEHIHRTEKI